MTPAIVAKNDKPFWVIGSSGGQTIISTNVQAILKLLDFGMNIAEAAAASGIIGGLEMALVFLGLGHAQDERMLKNKNADPHS